MLLHGAGIVIAVIQPALWLWILGVLAFNHLALTVAAFWPTGRLLGANITRLPQSAILRNEIALTFDDGPDPVVTLQVLDLLDRYQAKASFFCIGEKALSFPKIVKEIVLRGHSVENHSHQHSFKFSLCGIARMRREVDAAQSAIAGIVGSPPIFFRAPAGFRSPLLDIVLAQCGLHYASWTRRGLDGVRNDPALVLTRLTNGLAAGDVLLLHDGAHANNHSPAVLTVLPALLERMAQQGLKSVTLATAFVSELSCASD